MDPAVEGRQDQLLFSLARELLSNAVRHASATRVALRVAREPGALVLEIDDDGVGICEEAREQAVSRGHIGLASCVERVEALGGEVAIQSADGAGTHIRVTVPSRRATDREILVPRRYASLDVRARNWRLRPFPSSSNGAISAAARAAPSDSTGR